LDFNVFVSLPMRGLSIEDIEKRQKDIFERVALPEWKLLKTTDVVDEAEKDNQLWYLGRSIQILGRADVVIFANDWRTARGCVAEHLIAEAYGIHCLYEGEDDLHAFVE